MNTIEAVLTLSMFGAVLFVAFYVIRDIWREFRLEREILNQLNELGAQWPYGQGPTIDGIWHEVDRSQR